MLVHNRSSMQNTCYTYKHSKWTHTHHHFEFSIYSCPSTMHWYIDILLKILLKNQPFKINYQYAGYWFFIYHSTHTSIIILRTYCLDISSVERQMGLTTSHLHTQLDPFASKLTTCQSSYSYKIAREGWAWHAFYTDAITAVVVATSNSQATILRI